MRTIFFPDAIFAIVCLFLFGCSLPFSFPFIRPTEGTPEAKYAALRVTNDYLTAIMLGKYEQAQALVVWSDFKEENKVSKEQFRDQIVRLRKNIGKSAHPLSGLDPLEVDVRGDIARIRLQKHGDKNAPEIDVKLLWGGGGWLVVDDSVFGEGGLIPETLAKTPAAS